jgi:DHA2 family multidrug resistance protein
MATGRLDAVVPDSARAVIQLLAARVQREALVLSFNDIILLLGTTFVIGLLLMPLVRKPRPATAGH